ncbi:unnamed protein product [Protopolystoma xenopodis]|uniref:Uncharacterized protein n=1 Tax=Protopolystoma xenopodis TaxID=117903 RepID=A0A3S5BJA1_9PLAT|nr:unnamed protein product [Protopolystoma xenopodis]
MVRKIRIVLSSHDNRLLLRIRTGWLALRLTGQQLAPNAPRAAIPSPNDGGSSVSSRVCRVILSSNWGCTAGSGRSGSRAKQSIDKRSVDAKVAVAVGPLQSTNSVPPRRDNICSQIGQSGRLGNSQSTLRRRCTGQR